jgi:DNA-binding XRE family transcriptional regulator
VRFLSSINFNINLPNCRFHNRTFPNWNIEGRDKGLTFGAVLKACRKRAGLTQEEIAEKLHRSWSCISKFETDKKTLDVATLIKWADVTSAKDVACAL